MADPGPSESRSDPLVRGAAQAAASRPHVGLARLGYGLLGAPLAWSVQQVAAYALVARSCLPGTLPLGEPALAGVEGAAAILIGAALLAAAVALLTALRSARETRASADDAVSTRVRFLAFSGVLVSLLFLLAIALNGLPLLLMRRC